MLENDKIIELLGTLFLENEFLSSMLNESVRCYVKVFGKVRAKDLCYRLNSNIKKWATIGIRQKLAASKVTTKKAETTAGKSKKKQKAAEATATA